MTVADTGKETRGTGADATLRSVSFLSFVLRFAEPGGVTVPGTVDQPQAVLDLDPQGRVQLPGTSLAGALREMVRGARGAQTAEAWFGPLLDEGAAARVSRIWVLGSRRLDDAAAEVLASTRISRERGAAASNTFRQEEVLPAGAQFEAFLRWDDADAAQVADLAALIAAWRPLVGRGVTRGRGRCAVQDVRHGTLGLHDPGDLLRWLTLSGPGLVRDVATEQVSVDSTGPDPDLLFRVPVSITGPWRIGTGEKPPKGSREPIPLRRLGGQPVVPGSAMKGLLRSRAEFILRSVGVTPAPCADKPCDSEKCWTCRVFGYGGGQDSGERAVGARAAVRVADAVVADPVPAQRTHVAIDRFTGGALDGALYTMQVLEAGSFPLAVERLPGVVDDELARQVRAVLRLVLEDLNDGIIGMGGGTARGYGSVRVEFDAASGLPTLAEARSVLAEMARGGSHDLR
ncbi:MAG: RAMP superfamily CRISPR-associated protein [Streptosporangiaceae bacterium]